MMADDDKPWNYDWSGGQSRYGAFAGVTQGPWEIYGEQTQKPRSADAPGKKPLHLQPAPGDTFEDYAKPWEQYAEESASQLKTGAREFAQGAKETVTEFNERYREGYLGADTEGDPESLKPWHAFAKGVENQILGSPAAEFAFSAGAGMPDAYLSSAGKMPANRLRDAGIDALRSDRALPPPAGEPAGGAVSGMEAEGEPARAGLPSVGGGGAELPQAHPAAEQALEGEIIGPGLPAGREEESLFGPGSHPEHELTQREVDRIPRSEIPGGYHAAEQTLDEPKLRMKGRREISQSLLERVDELRWRESNLQAIAAQKAARRKELFKDWPDERLQDYIRRYSEEMRGASWEWKGGLRAQIDQYQAELAARSDERAAADLAEHATQLPEATIERQLSPQSAGAQAVPRTPQQAAGMAATGRVDRFVLRKLENIFHRQKGAEEAAKTEILADLTPKQAAIGSPADEALFRHGEGDPVAALTPEEQALFDSEIQPWRQKNFDLWSEIKALKKGKELEPEFADAIEELNPNYMHRRTIFSAKQKLGLDEENPVTGFRQAIDAPATKDRNYFAIDDGQGHRRVVFLDGRNLYAVSQSYPDGQLIKDAISLPKEFKPEKGARFNLGGKTVRIVDATSREIEDAGGPQYVKSALVSTRLSNLELTKMRDGLLVRQELRDFLKREGLSAEGQKPGYVKTDYPGLSGLRVPSRIAHVLKHYDPLRVKGEDPLHYLQRAAHNLTSALFWNPIFHGGNVAAHAAIERGWRWINPVADLRYLKHFRDAWRDVATFSPKYKESLREGARLMLGPTKAWRDLDEIMFSNIKELQESMQGRTLLERLGKATKVPPLSFVRGYYRWASDSLWRIGDVLTQAAIYDRKASYPKETLAETIMRVHREIPSYRIPVEEMLPGAAGRAISGTLQAPGFNAVNLFNRYHENIMRGLVLIGEDIIQGIRHPMTPAARQAAGEALGKVAAISVALGIYNYVLDPTIKRSTGKDDQIAKRFGPFSYLQLLTDWLSEKQLSKGSKVRASAGGFYSPSPLVELGANLGGYHAYSMSPIYPPGGIKNVPAKDRYKFSGQDVPWRDRLEAMGGAFFAPTAQVEDLMNDPQGALWRMLGISQFGRKAPKPGARY